MKKLLLILLAVSLLLAISCQSFASSPKIGAQNTENLQGKPWVNSNIFGNWPTKQPALEDGFELYANYNLYMKALSENKYIDDFYTQSGEFQEKKIKELIADTSKTSDELELIRAYYSLFADFDKRNRDGNGPLIDYRDSVTSKNNVKELSEEVQKGLIFGNPFATIKVDNASNDRNKYGVWIDFNLPISAKLSSDYTDEDMANVKSYLVYLLVLAGYNEQLATDVVDGIEKFEIYANRMDQEFMELTGNASDEIVFTSLDEIKNFCTPLYDLIIGLGYYSEDGDPVCYNISNAGMFDAMEKMYMDDNLEILKAIYVCSMAEYAMDFLDMDTYMSMYNDIENIEDLSIEEISYNFITTFLKGAVDQVYLEFVLTEGLRDQIITLTERYIKAMGDRLKNETWLSGATKQKALDKLEKMVYVVVYPDDWIDYSELAEIVKDHDQFLLDAVLCRDDFYRDYMTSFLGKDVERGNWVFSDTKTTDANAYYIRNENSINILAGVLTDTLFYNDSIETVLASIGATIGHEITHGFDPDGSQFNGLGEVANWWTAEDRENFDAKAQRVADALSKIYLADDVTVNGEHVLNETVADLGGLVLSLDIAKDYHDFNYDRFFRTYALMWYSISGEEDEALERFSRDNHAADYVRANFTLQMVPEFYKTYPQVKEGTAMYLSTKDRLSIW